MLTEKQSSVLYGREVLQKERQAFMKLKSLVMAVIIAIFPLGRAIAASSDGGIPYSNGVILTNEGGLHFYSLPDSLPFMNNTNVFNEFCTNYRTWIYISCEFKHKDGYISTPYMNLQKNYRSYSERQWDILKNLKWMLDNWVIPDADPTYPIYAEAYADNDLPDNSRLTWGFQKMFMDYNEVSADIIMAKPMYNHIPIFIEGLEYYEVNIPGKYFNFWKPDRPMEVKFEYGFEYTWTDWVGIAGWYACGQFPDLVLTIKAKGKTAKYDYQGNRIQ